MSGILVTKLSWASCTCFRLANTAGEVWIAPVNSADPLFAQDKAQFLSIPENVRLSK